MSIEIRVPQLPESIADATLVAWHKNPGDAVSRDENLADLETDKVVLEVPAPRNGIVREILIQSGATVTPGQLLAVIDDASAVPPGAAATPGAASAPTQRKPMRRRRAKPMRRRRPHLPANSVPRYAGCSRRTNWIRAPSPPPVRMED